MPRRLPVTLIGGALGAGKTSLLHHFVQEHRGGHLAIFVEESGALAIDTQALRGLGGAMRRLHDEVETIPAHDDLSWLADRLQACARSSRFERVLIEVAGFSGLDRFRRELAPQLDEAVEWQHAVCLVDALEFFRHFLHPKAAEVRDPLRDFRTAQIAEATLIILNKSDLVSDAERNACVRALLKMNPSAELVETAYGEIPAGVLDRPAVRPQVTLEVEKALPELSASIFRAHRPFHPRRFWDWLNAEHAGLLRVKGITWLASRNLLVGGVSRTRWQNACGLAGIWWAALPREDWPSEDEKLAAMQETWREPYGDRRQELLLIGDAAALPTALVGLNRCLLTAEEFARPAGEWTAFPDPFPEWNLADDQT